MKKHLVVALAYDRLCTFEFGCTVELFALERPELDVDWYDFAVCAVEEGPIRAAGGIVIEGSIDGKLRVFNDETGGVIKEIDTGSALIAAPMTCASKPRRQF